MSKIPRVIDEVNDWIGRLFSYGVLVMFVLVLLEVILRYAFNSPTVWTNELTQFVFGAYVVLSGGYIMRWGGHVNVDIIYSHLSARGQALMNILTFPLFLMFSGMLLVFGGFLTWESIKIWEHSESAWNPPVYPAKLMIPLGAFLLIMQGVSQFIRNIRTLFWGEKSEATAIIEKETL